MYFLKYICAMHDTLFYYNFIKIIFLLIFFLNSVMQKKLNISLEIKRSAKIVKLKLFLYINHIQVINQ